MGRVISFRHKFKNNKNQSNMKNKLNKNQHNIKKIKKELQNEHPNTEFKSY